MKVKRIVANISTKKTRAGKKFYQDILGLEVLMDHGWLMTYGTNSKMTVQLSVASQGGSEQKHRIFRSRWMMLKRLTKE